MKSTYDRFLFHGVNIPKNGPSISHLFYADDALFVGEWARSNFSNLAKILKCFHAASDLKVNFNKCKVYGIRVSDSKVATCTRVLRCDAGSLPFDYLGVQVGANMELKHNWKPIIEKVQSKLSV